MAEAELEVDGTLVEVAAELDLALDLNDPNLRTVNART